ncbi:MAG: helix-turn-helix domain-containing protein [Lutibacter sp.]|jgi:chromosomal replication initiator protein
MTNEEIRQEIELHLSKIKLLKSKLIPPESIKIEAVMKIITNYFEITTIQLESKSRKRETAVLPRSFFFLFSKVMLELTLARIGHYTGGRSHSTVLKSINVLCDQINFRDRDVNYDFKQLLSDFEDKGYDVTEVRNFVKYRK